MAGRKYIMWDSDQTPDIRRKRLEMHADDPNCYWCEKLTRLVNPPEGPLPDDAATVDHIVSRLAGRKRGYVEVVLACLKCNNDRNVEETLSLPYVDRLKRGGGNTPIIGNS